MYSDKDRRRKENQKKKKKDLQNPPPRKHSALLITLTAACCVRAMMKQRTPKVTSSSQLGAVSGALVTPQQGKVLSQTDRISTPVTPTLSYPCLHAHGSSNATSFSMEFCLDLL